MPDHVSLGPKQSEFWSSKARIAAFIAGWGSGKSFVARLKLLTYHLAVPGVECWAGMASYRQIEDSLIPDFFRALPQLERYFSKGDLSIAIPNGSKLVFRYFEDPEKITNINLRACWIEQAEGVPEESVIRILGRLRHSDDAQLLLTGNTAGQNWLGRWLKGGQSPYPFTLTEADSFSNREHLPAHYLAFLERLRATRPAAYQRFVLNSWASTEGAVWPQFSEAVHVIDPFPVPETWRQGISLDHGYRNPTAVLWWAVDQDGVVYLVDEHYEAGKVAEHHAAKIKERPVHTWQDAVADQSIFAKTQQEGGMLVSVADRYLTYGIPVRPASRKVDGELLAVVGEWFERRQIKIFRNCVNTIREIRDYEWTKHKQSYLDKHDPQERPRDIGDHTCDCLAYLIADRPIPALPALPLSILETVRRRRWDYEEPEPQPETQAGIAGLP